MKIPAAPRRAARFQSSTTHLKQKRRDSQLGCLKIGPKVGFWVCRKADALGGRTSAQQAHQIAQNDLIGRDRPQILNQLRCHHHHLHHERGPDALLCTAGLNRGYPRVARISGKTSLPIVVLSHRVLRYLTV